MWVQWASEGGSAAVRRPPPPPLDSRSLERLRGDISRAAADANADLVSLDVLLAHGHAWAALLHVDEPHSFCRLGFRRFFEAVEHWSKLCAGQFLEVRDASERSVLATANGWSSLRQDLACCDPLFIYGRTLDSPPRPRCPVFRD